MVQDQKEYSEELRKIVSRGLRYYQKADYEHALQLLEKSLNLQPEMEYYLYPYLHKCRNVLSIHPSDRDFGYLKDRKIRRIGILFLFVSIVVGFMVLSAVEKESSLFKTGIVESSWNAFTKNFDNFLILCLFALSVYSSYVILHNTQLAATGKKSQCKYCGHYTEYIGPGVYVGFMGHNNCEVCGRSYPMPDVLWDSWMGLDGIAARHSVQEEEFYKEYEQFCAKETELRVKYAGDTIKRLHQQLWSDLFVNTIAGKPKDS